jgi:hypothetical protein
MQVFKGSQSISFLTKQVVKEYEPRDLHANFYESWPIPSIHIVTAAAYKTAYVT